MYKYYKIIVDKNIIHKNNNKLRLDNFLINKIKDISRNQIQKHIKCKKVDINGTLITKNNYKIKPMDIINVKFKINKKLTEEEIYNNLSPKKIKLTILYEDNDIIIIDKPAGIVVHPGCGNENNTIIHGIKYINKNFNNLYRGGLIHRLDKDTSGILIFAKNITSQNYLMNQFFKRKVYKQYLALVWGNIYKHQGIITGYIGRDPKNRKRMKILPYGKYTITHYKVLKKFHNITLISCNPKTGRTHQLRTHFKHLGNPIFNDSLYGGGKNIIRKKKLKNIEKIFFKKCLEILPRQALHAEKISFLHPKNMKQYKFYSKIPNDINNLIKKLEQFTVKFHSEYNKTQKNI